MTHALDLIYAHPFRTMSFIVIAAVMATFVIDAMRGRK